jgi:hypothetical protein
MFCHQGVAIRQCSTRPTRVAAHVSKTLQHAHTPTHPPHSSAAALKTLADSSFHVSSILIPYSYHYQLLRRHPCTSASRSHFNVLGARPNARPLCTTQLFTPILAFLVQTTLRRVRIVSGCICIPFHFFACVLHKNVYYLYKKCLVATLNLILLCSNSLRVPSRSLSKTSQSLLSLVVTFVLDPSRLLAILAN